MVNPEARLSLYTPKQSLQLRLLISLGGTLVITLIVIVVSISLLVTRLEQRNWQERQESAAKTASLQIREFVDRSQRTLLFVAEINDLEHINDLVSEVVEGYPQFNELALLNPQGEIFAYSSNSTMNELTDSAIRGASWYEEVLAASPGTYVISEMELDEQGLPYLIIATPISRGGVAVVNVHMDFINEVLTNLNFGETGNAYLVEAEGKIIAHTDNAVVEARTSLLGRPELPELENRLVIDRLLENSEVTQLASNVYTNFQGLPVVGTVKVIPGTDWVLFTEIAQSEAYYTSRSTIIPLVLFTVLFWGGAMISTALLIRSRIFKPMNALNAGQQDVATGNLDVVVKVSNPDELGVLTQGFNQMVSDLRQRTSDQSEAEKALVDSEKRYRDLVENVSDIVYTIDTAGYFTYVSPSAAALTGYAEAELVGMHFTQLIETSWQSKVTQFYKDQMDTVKPETSLAFLIVTAQRELRWVEQKTSLIFDERRTLVGFQSVVRDITERKLSEERLHALYTVMAQPTLSIDDQLTAALKIGVEQLGMEQGIINRIQGEIYHILYTHSPAGMLQPGQSSETRITYCDIAYRENAIVALEHVGSTGYRELPCYQIFNQEAYMGAPLHVHGEKFGTLSFFSSKVHTRGFTPADRSFFSLMGEWVSTMLERKFAEDALRTSEANLRSMLDSTPAIISRSSRDGIIEFVHVPGIDYDLLSPFIGQNLLDFMLEEFRESSITALRQVFDEQKTVNYESRTIDPRDGSYRWYLTNVAPIIEDGVVKSALLVNSDISERKATEQKIQSQNEALVRANRELAITRKQAEAANKLKSQFLATMSHELRTPLNAVIGYAQLQLAGMVGDMTDEQLEFQDRILVNAQHLLQLINEVLDLSKIEAGRMELAEKPFDIRECLEEVMLQNRVLAEEKALDFTLKVDERLPETIIGDRGRIKQVIINLVSNAIKYTDEGSITVETGLYNRDSWRVTVTDTGIGISPTMQETIFDEFRQAENGIERGGTGLGLAIVRKLVLMMGGNIRLTSEVGRGSSFTITLPITKEPVDIMEDGLEAKAVTL